MVHAGLGRFLKQVFAEGIVTLGFVMLLATDAKLGEGEDIEAARGDRFVALFADAIAAIGDFLKRGTQLAGEFVLLIHADDGKVPFGRGLDLVERIGVGFDLQCFAEGDVSGHLAEHLLHCQFLSL